MNITSGAEIDATAEMTDEERDAQRRSFAVGLMSLESPLSVEEKRRLVDAAVDAEGREQEGEAHAMPRL